MHVVSAGLDEKTKLPYCTFEMKVPAKFCNQMGTMHGGMTATILDDFTSMPLMLLVGAIYDCCPGKSAFFNQAETASDLD